MENESYNKELNAQNVMDLREDLFRTLDDSDCNICEALQALEFVLGESLNCFYVNFEIPLDSLIENSFASVKRVLEMCEETDNIEECD